MVRYIIAIACILLISSCSTIAVNNPPLVPESLISASSEKVSFMVESEDSINEIFQWIEDDKPTRVNISCVKSNKDCQSLYKKFEDMNIPSANQIIEGEQSNVDLVYERVLARDCKRQKFGCSVASNALQMVADHKQFTSPALSDKQDAAGAVEAYRSKYLAK